MEEISELEIEYAIRFGKDTKEISDIKSIEFEKLLKDSSTYIFNYETQDAKGNPVAKHIHGYCRFPASLSIKTIRTRIRLSPWYKSLPKEDRGNGSYSLKQIPDGKWKDSQGYLRYIHKQSNDKFDQTLNITKSKNITDEFQQEWNRQFWQVQEKIKSEKKLKTISGNTCQKFLIWIQDKYTIDHIGADTKHFTTTHLPDLHTMVRECTDFLKSINSSYIMPQTYERLINYVNCHLNEKSFNLYIFNYLEKKILS